MAFRTIHGFYDLHGDVVRAFPNAVAMSGEGNDELRDLAKKHGVNKSKNGRKLSFYTVSRTKVAALRKEEKSVFVRSLKGLPTPTSVIQIPPKAVARATEAAGDRALKAMGAVFNTDGTVWMPNVPKRKPAQKTIDGWFVKELARSKDIKVLSA